MQYYYNNNHERTLGSIGEIAIPIPACNHAGFAPGEVFVFQAKPGHIGIRKRDEGLRVLPDDVYLDLSSFCNGMNRTTGEENRQLIWLLTRECHRTVQDGIFFSLIIPSCKLSNSIIYYYRGGYRCQRRDYWKAK